MKSIFICICKNINPKNQILWLQILGNQNVLKKSLKFNVSNFSTYLLRQTEFEKQSLHKMLEHVYMRPEVNSNQFEISLRGKISLRCKVTSLFAFT